jgi:small subunit ribosomal protein S20
MAHTSSAKKRIRQNVRHHEQNQPFRTRAARTVREARAAIRNGDDDAAALVREAQSALDRAAKRAIIHPNNASRRKSRLAQQLKSMQTGAAA